MANWDNIMNNRLTMGRARQLCYAQNAERRRREEEEEGRPGAIPLIGRGIRLIIPRFQHWDGFWEENFYPSARGRSRSYPLPQPFLQIHYHRQTHSLPYYLTGGFGHVAPNVCLPRVNNPPPPAPNPPQNVPPPSLPFLDIKNQGLKVPPQSPLTLMRATPSKPIATPLRWTFLLFYSNFCCSFDH